MATALAEPFSFDGFFIFQEKLTTIITINDLRFYLLFAAIIISQ